MDSDEILNTTPPDSEPLEVKIKKDKDIPPPSFDYDDYSPSEQEIMDIEKEVKENIEKRTKHGT